MMWFSDRSLSGDEVYRRKLPSGGYVAIATEPVQPFFDAPPTMRGRIVVERRSEARRAGHPAPIAAIAEHEDIMALLNVLLPVAESDEILTETLARGVTVPLRSRLRPRT